LKIKTIKISELRAAKYNPRKNLQPGDKEYDKLKKSMLEFDYIDPVIWNERSGNIVGGHQRLKILREMGHEEIDVSVVDLDDVKEKALNLALNKTGGDWDLPMLSDLLIELDTGDFDIEITGFDAEELEALLVDREIGDGLGEEIDNISLNEQFLVPPFSVLDARQGYWQARKKAWLSLGIQSEIGRGGGLLITAKQCLSVGGEPGHVGSLDYYRRSEKKKKRVKDKMNSD